MLGDELSGLISQLPRGLIAMTCVAGFLWAALLAYFAVIRPSRKRKREALKTASPEQGGGLYTAPAYVPAASHSMAHAQADMPDLDLLMQTDEPDFPLTSPARAAAPASGVRRLGSADIRLADGLVIHAPEAMVVLRDPRDGKLIVQLGDTGYKSLDGASGVRSSFEDLMQELGRLAAAPAPMPPAPIVQEQTEVLTPGQAPVAQTAPPVMAAAPPPSPTGTGVMPGDLPRYSEMKDEIKSRGAFRAHKSEMPAIPELNIPAAIEAYLQYKKSFTPEYAQRSIHVLPAPGGGVRIEVDGNYYDGVSDVADAEVRAFLQSTIQEWQKRQ